MTVSDSSRPTIVLFRRDLRLGDNLALVAAVQARRLVIPVFVFDELTPGVRPLGGARRWWLQQSLIDLDNALRRLGSRLVIRSGSMADVVFDLAKEANAAAVFWNRRYDAASRTADADMKARLTGAGMEARSHAGALLHEPWLLQTDAGASYRAFTPFWKAFLARVQPRPPVERPEKIVSPGTWPAGQTVADLDLVPARAKWTAGLSAHWTPGEAGADDALAAFIRDGLDGYAMRRDFPSQASSRLSPYMANGEITPSRVWAAIAAARAEPSDRQKYMAELGWREFGWHLLFHFPDLANRNFDGRFDTFDWRDDPAGLKAWQQGRTGYPFVDAGLRQLWTTGWMHNRARMVAASFLVKHLLIDWRLGERWFWDTLVDADDASNAANWQWVAGSGADAAPFFRIFNPSLQCRKFDADGDYIRTWVRELAALEGNAIHDLTIAAGQQGYPLPLVDPARARQRALEAFDRVKRATDGPN